MGGYGGKLVRVDPSSGKICEKPLLSERGRAPGQHFRDATCRAQASKKLPQAREAMNYIRVQADDQGLASNLRIPIARSF